MTYNPAKHNRQSIRLKGYDYAQSGLYFITICCHNRACIFGHIENGIMIMNQYGKIAHNHWKNTIEIRNNIELHEFVVMPNHIHGIIQISRRGVSHTPHVYNEMGLTDNIPTNDYHSSSLHGVCDTPLRSPSQTIGAIIRGYKSSVTKQLKLMGYNDTIWQRNYHEHIIRNAQSYIHISNYITNNPANGIKMYCNKSTNLNN